MAQTAGPTRNRNRLDDRTSMPRGYSVANRELSDHIIASFAGFYGSSEVLSYASPQFPMDDASIVERIIKEALKMTLTKLSTLLTWSAGWNGYDSLAPNPDAVLHAENWIVQLFLVVADSSSHLDTAKCDRRCKW